MKKLFCIFLLCAGTTFGQSVTNIVFVVLPVGTNTWGINQVYQREQLVNTNLVGIGLSNYVVFLFRQQLNAITRQEQIAARNLFNAFDASTNKVAILNLLGVSTNSVAPADLQ